MRVASAFLALVVASSGALAVPVTYTVQRQDGVGEQLRLELLAIPGIPQGGWDVEQNLRTGVITIRYTAEADLSAAQKTSVAAVLASHAPAFDSIGDDPPELLLGKVAYAQRHWSSLTAAQKDRLFRALTVLSIRGWGRWN